jgi:hypothetical protein
VTERRAATAALGLLSAVLLAAGILPWVADGPAAARYLAIPFAALGLLGITAAIGIPTGRFPHRPAPAPKGREHHCTRCAAHALTDPVRLVDAPADPRPS